MTLCIISDGLKSHFMFVLFVSFKQQLINRELPENVNLLTLENRSDGSYLIRLEHIYDVGEDNVLSKPVTVSLKVIFPFVFCKLNRYFSFSLLTFLRIYSLDLQLHLPKKWFWEEINLKKILNVWFGIRLINKSPSVVLPTLNSRT